MADDTLLQGKTFPWKVDDQGNAYVKIRATDVSLGAAVEYVSNFDQVNSTTAYAGKALPGTLTSSANWQIKKLTFGTDGDVTTQFADGDSNFDNIWDNRASLSYS